MDWKKGTITFDDGSKYPAEFLVNNKGQVWNTRIHKDGKIIEEINANNFASKLNMEVENVYPYSTKIEK